MSALSSHSRHIRIIGSGLIGTSIGLALRKSGFQVTMSDRSLAAAKLAQDLMGQEDGNGRIEAPVDLVLVATPSSSVLSVIVDEYRLNVNSTFMDVASIKSKPKNEVLSSPLPRTRFVPSHPMAGREVGGAESARADLFEGCIWAYDPDGVDSDSLALSLEVITACGATPLAISAEDHDRAVALVSHMPQAISSLLAKQLEDSEGRYLDLAGGGLRDTTRIAASSPALWSEILSSNAPALKPLLLNLQSDLASLIENLDDPTFIASFIEDGNRGRSRIPGKHGGRSRSYSYLPVVIEDKPGQLAALFDECARAAVNVEDLTIEHSPEQFTGLITLALSNEDAKKLFHHLEESGWKVHSPR